MRHFPILFGLSMLAALTLLKPTALAAPSFQWIGGVTAEAVSADGNVVVGARETASGVEAFLWTAETGIVGLGDLPGGAFHSVPTAVSADGSVVVGRGHWGSNLQVDIEAFRWTQSTGMVGLGDIGSNPRFSLAWDVSADGTQVVGVSVGNSGYEMHGFGWTESGGMVSLVNAGPKLFHASGVSADGSALIGFSSDPAWAPVRWSATDGSTMLIDAQYIEDISDNGLAVVGGRSGATGLEAFRWMSASGMVGLGDLPGGASDSVATATSSNGAIVVGRGTTVSGSEAFLWSASGGIKNLADMLRIDYGLDLSHGPFAGGLEVATGVSADGRTIVGWGSGGAWIATTPAPEPSTFVLVCLCLPLMWLRSLRRCRKAGGAARSGAIRLTPIPLRLSKSWRRRPQTFSPFGASLMTRLFFGLALCALLVLCSAARAAVIFTYAEATAQTSGTVGNGSWTATQIQPISTPTAGESATAMVTRTATGTFGIGNGMTTSVLSLNTQGYTGTMNHSASITANTSPFGIAVFGVNTSGHFVDFTLSASHNYSVAAGGHLNAPDSPDDQFIGVQIQLIRNSSGATPVDFVQLTEGSITLNQSGLIAAGTYSFYATMGNRFEFDSAQAGVYAGDAELMVSLGLTAIPEPTGFTLAALAMIASSGSLWRTRSRRSRRDPAPAGV